MATTKEFIEYICDQIKTCGSIRYRKMFGEYMVYVNDKPLLLVCDSTVYVKNLDCIREKMNEAGAELGIPYEGAKEHFILDTDNASLCQEIIAILEKVTPVSKPRKKKADKQKTDKQG